MVHDREPGFPELEGAIVARSGEGSLPIRGLTSMERLKCGSTRCWLSLPPCNGVVDGLQGESPIWFLDFGTDYVKRGIGAQTYRF